MINTITKLFLKFLKLLLDFFTSLLHLEGQTHYMAVTFPNIVLTVYALIAETTRKIGQFYQPPSHGSCIFFQCRCKLIFFWKFVTFVSGMQHVIMKMTMCRFTMPQYEYYKTSIALVGPYFGGVNFSDFDRKMQKSKVLPRYKSVRSVQLF